jgi:hypothetical protein
LYSGIAQIVSRIFFSALSLAVDSWAATGVSIPNTNKTAKITMSYKPFKRVPNANTTKPTNNAQNPVEASIGMMPKNDRNPTAASITAIQKTITLGALSLMMTPPFTI